MHFISILLGPTAMIVVLLAYNTCMRDVSMAPDGISNNAVIQQDR